VSAYRLVVHSGDTPVRQGTAWLLGTRLVVTAFHVVGESISGTWLHDDAPDVSYRLELRFDLELMSSVSDASGIRNEGRNRIVVAAVGGALHFRIFGADGKVHVDTDETRLSRQARRIDDLREKLKGWWPPHSLARTEKDQVIAAVTSIVDSTPPAALLTAVDRDTVADIALLRSDEALDTSDVLVLSANDAVARAGWRAAGFPKIIGRDFVLEGTITNVRRAGASDDLQLHVIQRTDVSWEGASGSAILVGGKVVGVLTEEVPRADSLWGARVAPLWALLKRNEVGPRRGGPAGYPGPDFSADPELAPAYLSPWSVYESVKLDRLKRRERLELRLDDFLSRNDRGLFVVEAEAGLGKTSFLVQLAATRGYPHHFVELAPGPGGYAPGVRNLAAQVIRAWGLEPGLFSVDAPGDTLRPHFLQDLLKQAADRRDRERPGERIVLVVDALDEAGPPPDGQNVLGLPRVLPGGVYLVVSQRPVDVPLTVEAPREVARIEAQAEDNLAVMRAFLEAAADEPGVKKAREESRPPVYREAFVETMISKSQGVWVYLKYVLEEIESGRRPSLKLENLPQGLWQYYQRFWAGWKRRSAKRWHSLDVPLLTTLAAVQEGLTLEELMTLAGLEHRRDVTRRLRTLLDTRWSPFLATSSRATASGPARTYRLYHASLRDYFTGPTVAGGVLRAEEGFDDQLAVATRQAHGRVSDYFTTRWGVRDRKLPDFWRMDPARLDPLDQYGVRNVATHMDASGRGEDLHRLLRLDVKVPAALPRGRRRENVWFTLRDQLDELDRYLLDLGRAWQRADQAFARDPSPRWLALQCRYALISALLSNLAIPPELLLTLVAFGVWPPSRALDYAGILSDPNQRAAALHLLAPWLDEALLLRALETAQAIPAEHARTFAMERIAARLRAGAERPAAPDPPRPCRGTGGENLRTGAPGPDTGPVSASELLAEFGADLKHARSIEDGLRRANALMDLAEKLDEPARSSVLGEVRDAIPGIGSKAVAALVLTELSARVAPPHRTSLLREAIKLLGSAWDQVTESIGRIVSRVEEPWPTDVDSEKRVDAFVKDTFDSIKIYNGHLRVLPVLADRLGAHELFRSLQEKLSEFRTPLSPGISDLDLGETPSDDSFREMRASQEASLTLAYLQADQMHRAATVWNSEEFLRMRAADQLGLEIDEAQVPKLQAFLTYLNETIPEERVKVARQLADPWSRSIALIEVANDKRDRDRGALVHEALTSACQVPVGIDRVRAFTYVAKELPEPERTQSLLKASGWALQIDEPRPRTEALIAIGTKLAEPVRAWILGEALTAACAIGVPRRRGRALGELATSLDLTAMPGLWTQALHRLARWPRRELVHDLRTLEPLITSLVGPSSANAVAREVARVGVWFS